MTGQERLTEAEENKKHPEREGASSNLGTRKKEWKRRRGDEGMERERNGSERKPAVRGTLGWLWLTGGGGEGYCRQTALGILVLLVCSLALNAI